MRLIDADALLVELDDLRFPGAPYVDAGVAIAIGKVCDAPTIEDRKTGRWILISDGYTDYVKCDQCGNLSCVERNFCSNCGAEMKEGEG